MGHAGTALVRRPGPRLSKGIVPNVERVPVGSRWAEEQWHHYLDALVSTGWDLVEVPPPADCPDAVFVEDTVVVYRNLCVTCLSVRIRAT